MNMITMAMHKNRNLWMDSVHSGEKKMKNIEKLYQKLSEIDNEEFYFVEGEFILELYNCVPIEKRPLCVIVFFIVSNWFAMSQRSGVWTFYEATAPKDIELTIQFLEQRGDAEFASIFRYGAHDYQNPKYDGNWNYPEEWIEESEEIDQWITDHENELFMWEKRLLIDNKETICSLFD